jgi:hypothetical protein
MVFHSHKSLSTIYANTFDPPSILLIRPFHPYKGSFGGKFDFSKTNCPHLLNIRIDLTCKIPLPPHHENIVLAIIIWGKCIRNKHLRVFANRFNIDGVRTSTTKDIGRFQSIGDAILNGSNRFRDNWYNLSLMEESIPRF